MDKQPKEYIRDIRNDDKIPVIRVRVHRTDNINHDKLDKGNQYSKQD